MENRHLFKNKYLTVIFFVFPQALGLSMTGISNHAKEGELDQFCDSVRNFATSVCGLTESSAQVSSILLPHIKHFKIRKLTVQEIK